MILKLASNYCVLAHSATRYGIRRKDSHGLPIRHMAGLPAASSARVCCPTRTLDWHIVSVLKKCTLLARYCPSSSLFYIQQLWLQHLRQMDLACAGECSGQAANTQISNEVTLKMSPASRIEAPHVSSRVFRVLGLQSS